MVMSFFRRGESGLDAIANRTVSMLADARHSFDMASTALLTGADPASVEADVRDTDARINKAEQELRGELVVHVAVQGPEDIAVVLSYTLLIKKIERIGDQAKNILDLAEEGVDFTDAPDLDELVAHRRTISAMITETADLLATPDPDHAVTFRKKADDLSHLLEDKIREYMRSEQPGSYAVPRAILYRYWKRIVANLGGVVTSATEPLQKDGYRDDGTDVSDD